MLVALGFGCGSKQGGSTTPTTTGPTSTTAPAPTTTPATTTPTTAPDLSVTDTDNGRTVVARRSAVVTLVLHSTYWKVTGSSDAAVLAPLSDPVVTPMLKGCVPGQGCGTVTVRYRASTLGRAIVAAERTTCGEARLCLPAERTYQVTVQITP
jgi:hypothetical protein